MSKRSFRQKGGASFVMWGGLLLVVILLFSIYGVKEAFQDADVDSSTETIEITESTGGTGTDGIFGNNSDWGTGTINSKRTDGVIGKNKMRKVNQKDGFFECTKNRTCTSEGSGATCTTSGSGPDTTYTCTSVDGVLRWKSRV